MILFLKKGACMNHPVTEGLSKIYFPKMVWAPVKFAFHTVMKGLLVMLVLAAGATASNKLFFKWADNIGGQEDEYVWGMAVDAAGNCYVTGGFSSPTLNLDTIALTNTGSYDQFIVKYDTRGKMVWAKNFGGTDYDIGTKIVLDHDGNLIVLGIYYSHTITFGSTILTNLGSGDIFLLKISPDGDIIWAKGAGGADDEQAYGLAVDSTGGVVVAGYYQSPTLAFGSTTLVNFGGIDMFVVKYDAGGNVLWAKGAGSTKTEYAWDVAVDSTGSSYVIGQFESSSVSFGTTTLINAGKSDIFLAKYSPTGNVSWAKMAGSSEDDGASTIAINPSGNCVLAGFFDSPTISFGATTLTNAGMTDILISSYDASGNVLWAKREGGSGVDYGGSLASDDSGNFFLSGSFSSSSMTLGSTTLTTAGLSDLFIAKYSPSGNAIWAKSAGGSGNDASGCVALDAAANCYFSGNYDGPTLLLESMTLTNQRLNLGSQDAFVVKLLTRYPTITAIGDVPNDQGGAVRLKWKRSCDDDALSPVIVSYGIFRKASAGGIGETSTVRQAAGVAMDSALIGYDFVMSVPALQLPVYQTVVPTLEDSSVAGSHPFQFLVVARAGDPSLYYVSDPYTGYSVDNLPPISPAGLTASIQSGSRVSLTWASPVDPDVGHYDIYRSLTSGIFPSPDLKIGTSTSAQFVDTGLTVGQKVFYRIVAVDIHYNVSIPSSEVAAGLVGTASIQLANGWNLVSVPLVPDDYSKTALYPTAISNAFSYTGTYTIQGILKNGKGYWVKFNGAQTVPCTGYTRTHDTVDVTTGWNMIGSLSSSIPVTSVGSIPDGITVSNFFSYNGSYRVTSTLEPGRGYWVKSGRVGSLVLPSSGKQLVPLRNMQDAGELPPPPDAIESATGEVPADFSLTQNYPNPANPQTSIRYGLPYQTRIVLTIYNILGEQVAVLADEEQAAGFHQVQFDGARFASGVYFYRLTAGDPSTGSGSAVLVSKKLTLIK
jgi:hypothetical protein